ncbi:MAG: alpha/beta hydrolase [Chloroflexota bacterium]|nr:alpha/beta hydrolase [Chloroflexota bacterium]
MQQLKINYTENGYGHAVLLLHGFPFDHAIWHGQTEALAKSGHIFTIDLPGFGTSQPLPNESPATIDMYAEAVARWIKAHRRRKIVLGGHSMAGYIALALARLHPEMLRGLILISTRPGPDSEEGREGRYKLVTRVEIEGAQAVADAMLSRLLAPATLERHPEVRDRVHDAIMRQSKEGIKHALVAMATRPDATPDLKSITVPTLIISGTEDAIIPAGDAELMRKRIPQATHVPIDKAGHLPMMEAPDEFNQAVESFLAALP